MLQFDATGKPWNGNKYVIRNKYWVLVFLLRQNTLSQMFDKSRNLWNNIFCQFISAKQFSPITGIWANKEHTLSNYMPSFSCNWNTLLLPWQMFSLFIVFFFASIRPSRSKSSTKLTLFTLYPETTYTFLKLLNSIMNGKNNDNLVNPAGQIYVCLDHHNNPRPDIPRCPSGLNFPLFLP